MICSSINKCISLVVVMILIAVNIDIFIFEYNNNLYVSNLPRRLNFLRQEKRSKNLTENAEEISSSDNSNIFLTVTTALLTEPLNDTTTTSKATTSEITTAATTTSIAHVSGILNAASNLLFLLRFA